VKKTRAAWRPAEDVADDVRSAFLAIRSLGKSLRSVFHKLDHEHTGRVSIQDFGTSLTGMGLELSSDDLSKLAVLLHAENDDYVSYERLLAFVEHTPPATLAGPSRRRKRRQPTARVGRAATSGAVDDAAAASSAGPFEESAAEAPSGFEPQPSLGKAFAWLDTISNPEDAKEVREDARAVIMAAAEAAAEAMAKAGDPGEAWVAAAARAEPEASAEPASRKRPVTDQDPETIPSSAFGQAGKPHGSGFGFGMTLGDEQTRWSEEAGLRAARSSSGQPPSSRRARLNTDEDIAASAPRAPVDERTARHAAAAAGASAAASGSSASSGPIRRRQASPASAPASSGAGATAPTGPESVGAFTVMSRGLAAVSRLGAASILQQEALTAAKILVLEADPLVRQMVWEFLQTNDEQHLMQSIARIAMAIAGTGSEGAAEGGETESKSATDE
jgi:hypothetical protein